MRKIVVTGATGHLGQQVVRQLAKAGREVRAVGAEPVDHHFPVLAGLPVERVQADERDLDQITDALRGADVVLHIGAQVSIASGDDLLGPIDVSGVANVLDACRTHGVGRLVHVSSVAALIPDGPCGPPVDDGSLGWSEVRGEALVRSAIAGGMDAVIVYPTGIFGPGDPGRGHLNRMLLDVWRRRPPAAVGGGFDWVDVRDVATGIIAAAAIAPVGGRYLLSGHWHTIEELVARAADIGSLLAPAPPHVTRDSISTLDQDDGFDPARARCDLGYLPRPLDATLRDTYAWFVYTGRLRPSFRPGGLPPASASARSGSPDEAAAPRERRLACARL